MVESCQQCKYFDDRNSFCRRFPPTPLVIRNRVKSKFVVEPKFPIIQKPEIDWCGEFEAYNSEGKLLQE